MFKKDRVFIIAEAGINHNGNLGIAKKLITAAKECGADAIKFQAFKTDELFIERPQDIEHKLFKSGGDKSLFQRLKSSELSESDYAKLSDFAKKEKIMFFSSIFGEQSLEVMKKIKVPLFKIASCDLNNHSLLREVSKTGKPVIISVGMGDLKEIKEAVKILERGKNELGILHCVSLYPPVAGELNLQKIGILKKIFPKHIIGYSDHTLDIFIPVSAVALGAKIIEKHFTLDKNMSGLDHLRSADPDEFKKMVEQIRFLEKTIDPNKKNITLATREKEMRKVFRRSLVADVKIFKGTAITKEMLGIKRPGTGIPSSDMIKVIGRRVKRSLTKNTVLKYADLEK